MGLWLKCPGCQTKNPLSVRVCAKCGQSLDNIPRAQRIYVIGGPEATAPKAVPAAQVKAAALKPAKQPKKSSKKKS